MLRLVKIEIDKAKETKQHKTREDDETRKKMAEYNNAAMQELYELTQRKFLKQILQFCEKMTTNKAYPRLFFIDLMEKNLILSIERGRAISTREIDRNSKVPCVRLMCEHEEGWHSVKSFFVYNQLSVIDYAYLARVMNIIKHGNSINKLKILMTEQGIKIMNELENNSEETDLHESYISLRKNFINEFENGTVWSESLSLNNDDDVYSRLGLARCELKNGKILWLCENHMKQVEANVLSNNLSDSNTNYPEKTTNRMLDDMENISLDIF